MSAVMKPDYSDPKYLAAAGHLPPLTAAERTRSNADYAEWYDAATEGRDLFDRTSGETAWQWAFYTYKGK